jgi:putative endonuclease
MISYKKIKKVLILKNSKTTTGFTSIASDWDLVYAEEFLTKTDALKREKEIKAKKSRKYIEWLIAQLA